MYTPNVAPLNFEKQIIACIKPQIDPINPNIMILSDFNTPFSLIDKL